MTRMFQMGTHDIMALIGRAPWREAVTYRDTWPHEYVVIKKDGQEELLAAFCERIARGEGVECAFFGQRRKYLFLGEHKYWTMTDCPDMDLEAEDYVLNRALLYRDRRDFVIEPGDTGTREERTMDACEDEIEQLDVHTIWEDEALDFTPWLAENLHMLGDAIGLKLEPVQTEAPVGPYFLDILAREADDGAIVAIENQLEDDRHGPSRATAHLCDRMRAHIAVWVAPDFGYEHAQALHRLNEWTNGRIRFYGVKVEVIKKAGGDPSPRFRKVVYPGGWCKEATIPAGEMAPDKRKYAEFFWPLLAKLHGEGFVERPVQYYGHTGRMFRSNLCPGIRYAAGLDRIGASVKLSIYMDDKEFTKRIFDTLKVDREEIEQGVDAGRAPDWRWYKPGGRYAFATIGIWREGSIDDPPEKLEETRAWMIDLLPKLKEVFDQRLADVLDSR